MSGERKVTGTSLTSVQDAIEAAWGEVEGEPDREGVRTAYVTRTWLSGGGFAGTTQYHVELAVTEHDDG